MPLKLKIKTNFFKSKQKILVILLVVLSFFVLLLGLHLLKNNVPPQPLFVESNLSNTEVKEIYDNLGRDYISVRLYNVDGLENYGDIAYWRMVKHNKAWLLIGARNGGELESVYLNKQYKPILKIIENIPTNNPSEVGVFTVKIYKIEDNLSNYLLVVNDSDYASVYKVSNTKILSKDSINNYYSRYWEVKNYDSNTIEFTNVNSKEESLNNCISGTLSFKIGNYTGEKATYTCDKYKKQVTYVALEANTKEPIKISKVVGESLGLQEPAYFFEYENLKFLYTIDQSTNNFDISVPLYDSIENNFAGVTSVSKDEFIKSIIKVVSSSANNTGFADYAKTSLGYFYLNPNHFYSNHSISLEDGYVVLKPSPYMTVGSETIRWFYGEGLKKVLDDYETLVMFSPSSYKDVLYTAPLDTGGPRPEINPGIVFFEQDNNLLIYTWGFKDTVGTNDNGFDLIFNQRTLLRKYIVNKDGELLEDTDYIDITTNVLGNWLGFGYGLYYPLTSNGDEFLWFVSGVYEFGGPNNFAKIRINKGEAELLDTYYFNVGAHSFSGDRNPESLGKLLKFNNGSFYYSTEQRGGSDMDPGVSNIVRLDTSSGSVTQVLSFPQEYKHVDVDENSPKEGILYFKAYYESAWAEGFGGDSHLVDMCLSYNTINGEYKEYEPLVETVRNRQQSSCRVVTGDN